MPATADPTPERLLAEYHTQNATHIAISADQGSRFAKDIAGDHNPIHNIDAPRFCVPGDLLFALIASRYGLARELSLTFTGMLRADTPLTFPTPGADTPSRVRFAITDAQQRQYVDVAYEQSLDCAPGAVRGLIEAYVGCSGLTFPDLLHPLLKAHAVMFNPERPLVVYDSMQITLDRAPDGRPRLELEHAELNVEGKRGNAAFTFSITEGGAAIGSCAKRMVISGLRPYDADAMTDVVNDYQMRRNTHNAS